MISSIIAKVGRRGQLVLPREIRRRLNVEEGQHVAFVIQGGHITLCPLNRTLFDLRGSVKVEGPQDFEAIRESVLADIASRNIVPEEDGDA